MNNSEQRHAAIPVRPKPDYQPGEGRGDQESSESASQMAMSQPSQSRAGKEHLSPTEERILRLLADPESEAESNGEIAAALGITPGAVRQHLHRMYAFYGVRSIRGLFRRAASHAANK